MKVIHTVTTKANIDNVGIIDGQILVLYDGNALYYDMDGVRRSVSGIKIVPELPLVGDPSILYVHDTKIYRYDSGDYVLMSNIVDDEASEASTYSSAKIEELLESYLLASEKHQPDGVAALDENGLVYEDELPSFVRPLVVVDRYSELPAVGDEAKAYIAKDRNRIYRYDATAETYIQLSLNLGHTDTTAYPGDEGLADHEAVTTLGNTITGLVTRIQSAEDAITNLQLADQSLQNQISRIPINYLLNVEDITDLQSALETLAKDSYHNGDILVLVNEDRESNAFIYDSLLDEWISFASGGSIAYDANNIFFTRDIICAGEYTQVGNIEKDLYGTYTLQAAGKSLAQVMQMILTKELQPTKVDPSITIELVSAEEVVECGSNVSVSYSTESNTGSYTYDQTTGVTISELSVSDGVDHTYTLHTETGTFPALPVTHPETAAYQLYRTYLPIAATITYTAGNIAKTNMGNDSDPVVQIAAGITTNVASVAGRRSLFYGVLPVDAELTSAAIRNLTNVIDYEAQAGQTFTVDVSESGVEDPGSIVIAIPSEGPSDIHITKVIADGYFDPNITDQYELEDTVYVEGANGFTAVPYDIWSYKPDLLYSDDVHHITL